VLQEGDRVLAINGLYLESHNMKQVQKIINDSGVKMLLLVEFNVAGTTMKTLYLFKKNEDTVS